MKKVSFFLLGLVIAAGLGVGGYYGYQYYTNQNSTNKTAPINLSKEEKEFRDKILKMVMRDNTNGLYKKQGFIAVPSLNILLPIYNNAWDDNGLNPGSSVADLANNPASQSQDQIKALLDYYGLSKKSQLKAPAMGVGNYTMAAHNFGIELKATNTAGTPAGFGSLQKDMANQAPYIVGGQYQQNVDVMNGTKIYLINDKGVYEYDVVVQHASDKNDISSLNPKLRSNGNPVITIISCIAPNVNVDRLVTIGELKHTWTLYNAPKSILENFDLTKKETNARAAGWSDQQVFPGYSEEHPSVENKTWNIAEEGAQGNAGGTK